MEKLPGLDVSHSPRRSSLASVLILDAAKKENHNWDRSNVPTHRGTITQLLSDPPDSLTNGK
jgi:hypothetical protein